MQLAQIYEAILNNEMSLMCFQETVQKMEQASYAKGYMDRIQDVDVLKQAFLAECG